MTIEQERLLLLLAAALVRQGRFGNYTDEVVAALAAVLGVTAAEAVETALEYKP